MKKAEGLSLSVIVIAVVCLIVLVILTLIFTGRINMFNQGIDECQGTCMKTADECGNVGGQATYKPKCALNAQRVQDTTYCCMNIPAKS